MRVFLACFLVACGNNAVDDIVPIDVDATIDHRADPDVLFPPPLEAGPDGPVYVGGPLACGKSKCTCDGTLYACVISFQGCAGNPPTDDAGSDADADADANTSCTSNDFCKQIPTECLPKPTCECISKVLNLTCTVAPDGSGFILQCP